MAAGSNALVFHRGQELEWTYSINNVIGNYNTLFSSSGNKFDYYILLANVYGGRRLTASILINILFDEKSNTFLISFTG